MFGPGFDDEPHDPQVDRLTSENDRLRARVAELEEFARNVAYNYDCDTDAHRLGTRCRCCDAEALLNC